MKTALPVEKEISHYLEQLSAHQKEVVLSVVKTFARQESDWLDTVEDAAKHSINKGLKQAKAHQVTPHEEVMKNYKQWLSM